MNKAASLMAAPVFSGDMQADNYRRRHLEGVELPMEKAAHVESKPEPVQRSDYVLIKRAHEIIRGEYTNAAIAHEEAIDAFQKEAEEALCDNSLDEVLAALLTMTKEAQVNCLMTLQPVIQKLTERGMVKEAGLDVTAVMNGDHPLLTSYQDLLSTYENACDRYIELRHAEDRVEMSRKALRS
jgi:hypothetical protein